MRVLFLTNSDISGPLVGWLEAEKGTQVTLWSEPVSAQMVEKLQSDMIVSYNYRHIVTSDVLELMRGRAVNLHISYLPWNRGAHPNVWSFLEDTPKGVTIHLMDKGVDTGGILVQRELRFDAGTETFESTYRKLHSEIQVLFRDDWHRVRSFSLAARAQNPHEGSRHRSRDLDLLRAILAMTFGPPPSRRSSGGTESQPHDNNR